MFFDWGCAQVTHHSSLQTVSVAASAGADQLLSDDTLVEVVKVLALESSRKN